MNRREFLKTAAGFFLGSAVAKAEYLDDVHIFPNKPSEAEIDEIRQYKKLEEVMAKALRYEVVRGSDKRKLPLDHPQELLLDGKKKKVNLRVERLDERLRILIGIHEDNMKEKLRLGDLEVYLIHDERTRFEKEEFTLLFNRNERSVIYVPFNYGSSEPQGEIVVKQANGILTSLIKDVGVISRTVLTEIAKNLNYRNFQIWTEELDRVAEIGGRMSEKSVYVYPMELKRNREKFWSTREEKLREIWINAGEKKIIGVLIYYSLEKPVEPIFDMLKPVDFIFNIFAIPTGMEHEDVTIYPLDMPLSEVYKHMHTLRR